MCTASSKPSTLRVCSTWYTPIRARFCPAPWFPVCTARYRENQQNTLLFWIYFITGSEIHNRIYKFDPVCVLILLSLAVIHLLQNRIYKFDPVCVLIFLSLGCSVVMVLWFEPNKKFRDILLNFPLPDFGERKPTWWSLGWCLAKLAWYDVAWKPSFIFKWLLGERWMWA